MMSTIPSMSLSLALLAILAVTTRSSVEFPKTRPKHEASHAVVGAISFWSKKYILTKAACDEQHSMHTQFLDKATSLAASVYKQVEVLDIVPEPAKKAIKANTKSLGAGVEGVVYEVKMKNGGPNRALKIASCGTLAAEIYAQQKLKDVAWVNQMHMWGRSQEENNEKPKWDFYVMDMIDATLEKTWNNKGSMTKLQLFEALRLTLEAARELQTVYGISHNDLKLDNIAFTSENNRGIKLIDFGVAMPVTAENGIAAFQDFYRIDEAIYFLFGGGYLEAVRSPITKPLDDILDEVNAKILDDLPTPANLKEGLFPRRDYFTGYVHDKFMAAFAAKKWAAAKAKGKEMECALDKLYISLPPRDPK